MHAETRAPRSAVKVEGMYLLRKQQMARENVLCDRCGPGGWPGPHSFFSLFATPLEVIASASQKVVALFRVLFAPRPPLFAKPPATFAPRNLRTGLLQPESNVVRRICLAAKILFLQVFQSIYTQFADDARSFRQYSRFTFCPRLT
jgi:hypothetical protein